MSNPLDLVARLRTSIGPDVYPAMTEAADILERLNRWVALNGGEAEDAWGRGYLQALDRVRAELQAEGKRRD